MVSTPDLSRLRGALLAGLVLLPFAAPASAQSLYCCLDDRKRKICADRLPPACVGKPHTIRGPGGATQHVEGFVTPAERKAREAEEQRRKEQEEALAEQRRKDAALLATYGNERDIELARERAQKDVDNAIEQANHRIESAKKRMVRFEREAEFYKGKTPPPEISRGIRDAEYEIKTQNELIERKRQERAAIDARFADERQRYQALSARRRGDRIDRP